MVAIKTIAVAAVVAGFADHALAVPISHSSYETRDLGRRFDEGSLAQFFLGYRKLFRASHGYHAVKAKAHAAKAEHPAKAAAATTPAPETHQESHQESKQESQPEAHAESQPEAQAESQPEAGAEAQPEPEARDYEELDERDWYEDIEERDIELDERDMEEIYAEELYARYLAAMEDEE